MSIKCCICLAIQKKFLQSLNVSAVFCEGPNHSDCSPGSREISIFSSVPSFAETFYLNDKLFSVSQKLCLPFLSTFFQHLVIVLIILSVNEEHPQC